MTELAVGLTQLGERLAALLEVLQAEEQALRTSDADGLRALSPEKERQAAEVAAAWSALTGSLGLPSDAPPAAVAEAIGLRSDTASNTRWAEVRTLIDRTAMLNRLNGRLIEEGLRRTTAAMTVLSAAAGQGEVYGADGLSQGLFTLHHDIGEA
ncbi:MAG: flagellar protein FlgN [Thiobacillaceae bacterium]|nr:flagellar protein FlgN [Thiobacillaceae bacterium]MCX7673809.1 flagellar protein FlgN [Thiobacillaceae bacterium]MDW8323567.1 flagellar protein FlgN [Burkholderiales bacterium]